MMQINQLKALEIQGFKSFPDKTRLTFGKGITAVVGPNGSGKSNISDAVRWVLGEQSIKTLRGSKMEDVIFNGTVNRKPVGFAQVALTIDNESRSYDVDSNEIIVTRRLYRSGESEYRINNAPVRLKDIHELFMDTGLGRDGYSMVGQGKISEIVSSKPIQRREIFEEAAGISKYRYKKEDAERRLRSSEENLLRLADILTELEERVGPLEEQSKKAKKYLELAQIKKELEVSLWIHKLSHSNQLMKQHDDRTFAVSSDYDAVQQKLASIEEEVNSIYTQMQEMTISSDEGRKQISEYEEHMSELRAEIAVLNNDILHCNEGIQRAQMQIAELSDSNADAEIQDLDRLIEENNTKAKELSLLIEQVLKELSKSDDESRSVDEKAGQLQITLSDRYNFVSETNLKLTSVKTAIEQIEEQLGSSDSAIAAKEERVKAVKEDYDNCKELVDAIDEKLSELSNMKKGYLLKMDSLDKKYNAKLEVSTQINRSASDVHQKIEILKDLERNMDGFSGSVKAVIKQGQSGALRGIKGSVAQLIKVEQKYSTAVETALGAAMQNIVVADEACAKAAIAYLKNNNVGRATFLPMTSVKGTLLSERGLEECDGYVEIASELVDCKEEYRTVVRSLLGRTVIADDLDDAVIIAKKYQYRFRIVTLDGQVVNAGGSMTGGSAVKNAGILSRAGAIEKLEEKLKTLEADFAKAKAEEDVAKAELEKIKAHLDGLLAEENTANRDKARYSAEFAQLEKQFEAAKTELLADQNAKKLLSDRLISLKENEKNYSAEIVTANKEIETLESEMKTVSVEAGEFIEKKKALSEKVSELNLEKLSNDKDLQLLNEKLDYLNLSKAESLSKKGQYETEISEFTARIGEINQKISAMEKESADTKALIDTISISIKETIQRRQELEHKTVEIRNSEKDIISQRENLSGELARLEERKVSLQASYDRMITSLWEEYEMTRSQAEEIAKPIEDEAKSSAELNSCKNRIRALGNVNVDAIEEYKEVSERYIFLKAQVEDVEKSKAELKKLINEITEKMRKQFSEQFEKINRNFKTIFKQLFEGGEGELLLVESDDILESGIDIKVQPPGKIIKNIASLSGGEQSMIAIAIYFAIMTVNPSPFCILDEIDAALDDVNVTRYASYLRRMSEKTQFIAITHRRGTMEEADVLYGVTMQEDGVSKILELNVSEMESKMGSIK